MKYILLGICAVAICGCDLNQYNQPKPGTGAAQCNDGTKRIEAKKDDPDVCKDGGGISFWF